MGEDIISQLPDELLHHILSFIPIKKAVITSFLSSRWKNLCSTNPFLTLYLRHDQRYDSLLNFIDNRLVSQGPRHDFGIQRFHLKGYYTSDPVVKQYVDRWIELLAQREIKEMKLCFFDRKIYPQAILSAKSITVLHLSFGKLWDTGLSTDDVKLVSLKKLWLKHVEVSDFIIHRILSSSLDLEEISLKFCGGLTRMSIRDLNGLKRLKLKMLRKLRSVEIDAPSLVRFHYEIYYHSHCEVKFLNCLNLRGLSLNPLAYNQLSEEISTLDNLKYLKIQGFYVSEELLIISSSSLTSLICNYGNLSKVEINIPNLQYLKLRAKNIILVSLTAPPKEEAKLTFNILKMGIEEYISLLNILRELSGSKKVTLIVNLPMKNELIPDEWKVHIASVEYLTQSRNLWRDANIRLLDFLYMIFPNLHNIELTSTVLRRFSLKEEA